MFEIYTCFACLYVPNDVFLEWKCVVHRNASGALICVSARTWWGRKPVEGSMCVPVWGKTRVDDQKWAEEGLVCQATESCAFRFCTYLLKQPHRGVKLENQTCDFPYNIGSVDMWLWHWGFQEGNIKRILLTGQEIWFLTGIFTFPFSSCEYGFTTYK